MSLEVGSSQSIRDDYLQLLVTQLQNQNPLEPMDNGEMTAQLAQLASLEQMENLNNSFSSVLASEQRGQALAMMGKQVTYFPEQSDTARTGKVNGVDTAGPEVLLSIGSDLVRLGDVQEIRD